MFDWQRRFWSVPAKMLAICVSIGLSAPALATPTRYDFTFIEDSNFIQGAAIGDFSGSFLVENGVFIDIQGTGSVIGTITGLLPVGGYIYNDNVFLPTAPNVSVTGVSFTTSLRDSANMRIFNFGSAVLIGTPRGLSAGSLTVTPAAVPEPATLALSVLALAAGLGGCAAGRKRLAA